VGKIRVLLHSASPDVRALIGDALRGQRDFELVGAAADPVGLLLAVKRTRADVVIFSTRDFDKTGLSSHLLAEYPHLTLLAMAKDEAFLEQLCPHRVRITHPSKQDIVTALRRAIRVPCES